MKNFSYTEHYFTTPDEGDGGACAPHKLHYLKWQCKNPTAKTIICVHGLSRNAHDFDYIAEELSEQFNVISISMAGRGKSDWLDDKMAYNYINYAADCAALIKSLGLKNIYWLGTSMGGIIAMIISTIAQGLIERLVINDIGFIVPATALERITKYAASKPEFDTYDKALAYMKEVFAPFGINSEEHWTHFESHTLVKKDDGTYRMNYDPDILEPVRAETDNFSKIDDIDLSIFWENVTCPTMLLRGEESDILPIYIATRMAAQENVEMVEFDGIGHAPALFDDDQIALVKDWFLKE